MNILLLYASLEGQTAKIANYIGQLLSKNDYLVKTLPANRIPTDFKLDDYDAVIIGAPIHMGNYPRYLKKFVVKHVEQLNNMPCAFFTVCMAINSQQEQSRQVATTYKNKFMQQTHWHPNLTATFAGAVKYTQYNLITRYIMKKIAQKEGGSTDTSIDHEYTDWGTVANFTTQFNAKLLASTEEPLISVN